MAGPHSIPPDAGPGVFAAGASRPSGPSVYAPAAGALPAPPPPRKPWLRRFVLGFAAMLALLLALALSVWYGIGRDDSLAFVLYQAARALPEGQQLEAEGVRGSLRKGGHIARLRWHSDTLTVEAQDMDIGWSLAPLLSKTVRLGQLHARRVVVTPHPKPDDAEPTKPLTQLELPVRVELPFAVNEIVWAGGETPIQIEELQGRYAYDGEAHQLEIAQLVLPQGQGQLHGKARLQGGAPMALEAALEAQLQAPAPGGGAPVRLAAEAQARGHLAGESALLDLTAQLRQTDPSVPPTGSKKGTPPPAPMQADASARIAPWAPQPVVSAQAGLQGVDLAALWPQAPQTFLSGHVAAGPSAQGWSIEADLRNARAAPWDHGGLPVTGLQAQAQWDGTVWQVPQARVQAGSGAVSATGSFDTSTGKMVADAELNRLEPARMHSRLAAAPLGGTIKANGTPDDLHFDVRLAASGASRSASTPKADAGKLRLDRISASGRWHDGVLTLPKADVEALQARLNATQVRVVTQPALSASGKLQASVPGATVQADGSASAQQGAGQLRITVGTAQQTLAWLRQLPGLEKLAPGLAVQGNAALAARWRGGWENLLALQAPTEPQNTARTAKVPDLQLQATLDAPRLAIAMASEKGVTAVPTELVGFQLRVEGTPAKADMALKGEVRQGPRSAAIQTTVVGGLAPSSASGARTVRAQWQDLRLRLQDGVHPGHWTLQTAAPIATEVRQGPGGALAVQAGGGSASFTGPLRGQVALQWEPLQFSRADTGAITLTTRGSVGGIPLAWADLVRAGGSSPLKALGLDTDLVFGGQWSVDASDTLTANVRLARSSGDLRIAVEDAPLPTRLQSKGAGPDAKAETRERSDTIAAGVRKIELSFDAAGDELRAAFTWDSAQAGEVQARATTRLRRVGHGWAWPEDAPLVGNLRARLPQVGVWSVLAPPGWRVSGTLQADAALSGTRADPRWQGSLGADQLAVRSVLDGVDLQDGRMRATLSGQRVDITEFSLQGGRGSSARIAGFSGNRTAAPTNGGRLAGTGSVQWGAGGSGTGSDLRMDFRARADALQVLVRADRQASVSGTLEVGMRERQFKLRGDLRIDRAAIILPDAGAPTLGSDVVVRSAALDKQAQKEAQQAASASVKTEAALPPDVAVTLDLGEDFALQGMGITTRLEGKLDIRSSTVAGAPPRLFGEVRTVAGRYRAWGQVLDVETGLVRFAGPYQNPSLDILALRPNIEVRAGVQITGTAQAPRVRLFSEPELPDAEKLSWVVLGRSAASGGADAALLQQAALALLGGKGSGGANVANRIGLDEIGFKGPGTGEDATGAALTFGKRVSKNLYVTYERSLAGTLGTLYIFYDLSQRLRLRAQTGASTGLDLIYTVRYE